MMRAHFRVVLVMVALVLGGTATAQLGPVKTVAPSWDGATVQAGGLWIRVTALSDSTLRVRYSQDGKFSEHRSFAVVADHAMGGGEHAMNGQKVTRHDSEKEIVISAGKVSAVIERATGILKFVDASGAVIAENKAGMGVQYLGESFRVYQSMPVDEHYFGLGDKAGALDLRGQAFANWNTDAVGWHYSSDPLYKSIPFFIGLRDGKAYGIFLDNTYRTSFDFGKQFEDAYSFGSVGGELNYYFFYGPDPKSVISDYTALTGHTPLPPRCALGYQQSRWSYYPESRVMEVAKDLREHKIPADVIYLDIDYLDGFKAFDINRKLFPTFEQMVKDLGKMDFKLVVISDLHIAAQKGYKPYDEGVAGDHFVKNPDGSTYIGPVWPGPSAFPEFTLQRTRQWYGSLYKDFVQMGVRGFWNDMNEPSVFRQATKTMPLDTVHRVDDVEGERKTDHREIHNVVGLEQVRATYDGLRRLAPDLRPFVLTRAAYSGAQRYAATWTGDNTATWEHYRLQIPTLLSMGVSGYAFVGDDIGGFANSPQPDLTTRWFEVGAFTPLFRDHNANDTMPKEPWVHGPVNEAIRRKYIEERYRLLPYLYTLFEENSRDGLPVMRPLFLEYPTLGHGDVETEKWVGNDSEFLLGRDLLVTPIVSEGLNPLDVLLPPGEWYDYWTGEKVQGAHQFKLNVGLEQMPVFVRAGAIIPKQPVVQSTAEVPNGSLELNVYPGADCKGSVYWDDGESFGYQRGEYYRQEFTCAASSNGVTVDLGAVQGSFVPWWKSIRVNVYGGRAAKSITANGQAIQGTFGNGAVRFELPVSRGETKVDVAY